MYYIILAGKDLKDEINLIKRTLDEMPNTIFVYTGKERLNSYIDSLSIDEVNGLDDEYLYKLKICYERENLDIWFQKGNISKNIYSISSLIKELDCNENCKLIINDNSYEQLGFVLQQLIYINFPFNKIDVDLKNETENSFDSSNILCNSKRYINRFEKAIHEFDNLRINRKYEFIWDKIDDFKSLIGDIIAKFGRFSDDEVRIGIVASKKSGKSVFTNCLLEELIAPSSNLLATPNVTLYRKSHDNRYHCKFLQNYTSFDNAIDLNNYLVKQFNEAQNDKASGFGLEDMVVEYVNSPKYIKPNVIVYDTPGPDAAGTSHEKILFKSLNKLDIAVFIIDYQKYLTDGEEKYLKLIKEKFSSDKKFRSLIIVLNKVDMRFNDVNSKKSIVKSVDFIKSRLKDLSSELYGNTLIFPICAIEYLNCIISEKSHIYDLNSSDGVSINILNKLEKQYKKIEELHWLKVYADKLNYCGENSFSYESLKNDSGIPNLMEYILKLTNYTLKKNDLIFDVNSLIEKLNDNLGLLNKNEDLNKKYTYHKNKIDCLNERIKALNNKKYSLMKLCEKLTSDIKKLNVNLELDFNSCINTYIQKIKNSLLSDDISYELYEKFFRSICFKIRYLKNSNSTINGNIINDLAKNYDIHEDANDSYKAKFNKFYGWIIDFLNIIREDFVGKLFGISSELLSISKTYKTQFKNFNIDLELPVLKVPNISFKTVCLPNNLDLYLNLDDFNLFNRIKSAFEVDYSNLCYNIFSQSFWGNIKNSFSGINGVNLNLVADYETFKIIFAQNVKEDYCNQLSISVISVINDELKRVFFKELLEPNLNILKDEFNKAKGFSTYFNYFLSKFNEDLEEKFIQYNKEIVDCEKQIDYRADQLNDCSKYNLAIRKIEDIVSPLTKEFCD